jgi:hypothetical protein
MADTYTKGNVTVFGANAAANISGITTYAMISSNYTHNFTATELENSEGNTMGAVANDPRDDLILTFYPIPAQTTAGFKAIDLPALLAVVTISQWTPPGGLGASGNIPAWIAGTYNYIGGGGMDLAANGLMTMTLPLRRFGTRAGVKGAALS